MERLSWYLVVYDIADPRRLAKVHRLIKKKGIAAQRSVFFVQRTQAGVGELLDEMAALIKASEDDLRAYPIEHPAKVWSFGINPLAECPVVAVPETKRSSAARSSRKRRWWRPF